MLSQVAGCPICREPLDFISKDAQYDAMVAVVVAALDQDSDVNFHAPPGQPAEMIEIDFAQGDKSAGVCVQTCVGPGVRVSKVLKSGRFYDAGFRPDDLILDLNGTRCAAITGRSTARSFPVWTLKPRGPRGSCLACAAAATSSQPSK